MYFVATGQKGYRENIKMANVFVIFLPFYTLQPLNFHIQQSVISCWKGKKGEGQAFQMHMLNFLV